MNPRIATLALALACTAGPAFPQSTPAPASAERPARDLRFVVIHSPGPRWDASRSPFEQPGMQEHVDHYRQLQRQGRLEFGGPFMDPKAGGMMIPAAGQSEADIRRFAADDPAVKAGLLLAEVRSWLIGMRMAAVPKP